MLLRFALFSLVLMPAAIAARADTFTTYNLAATTLIPSNGTGSTGTVTGTVVLDETTGLFTTSNLIGSYNASSSNPAGTYTIPTTPSGFAIAPSGNAFVTNFGVFGGNYFGLVLPGTSLINYAGGPLCSTTFLCSGNGVTSGSSSSPGTLPYSFGVQSGSLTAAAPMSVTPEPSSLMLLATGALGLIGAARRRLA